ncbi:alpha-L RNA-binding motif-containing protein [Cantharellus anzutake]|uniref:alpha-L RNA-binding motif-containing protein n=1 Tax=Cantharellus anzutake TaxID=1750568 RepID=UPI0019067F94|nr:alpha-L RNA-binding motif-containing protein [Cantharellus anzutake]KAF8342663.1 alpha-L RNA-binding motif-containing protein [Cantharellus anzutake]
MRKAQPFNVLHSLPRMSWRPLNLYNLWRRSLGPVANETNFTRSSMTLFQQRWRSKRLVRGYHGDYIPEKKFKRWWLPTRLPDVRVRKTNLGKEQEGQFLQTAWELGKWSGRSKEADAMTRKAQAAGELAAKTPLGSLMFMEVERRLDTFIFRCCFAPSVYQARQMVICGKVQLNGRVVSECECRLDPGDMVTVDPKAMTILRRKPTSTPDPEPSEKSDEKSLVSDGLENSQDSPKKNSEKPFASSQSLADSFKFPDYSAPFLFLPAYIESNPLTCSAVYLRHPTARPGYSEIPTPYDADGDVMRFAWEWYSKVRPRTHRGKFSKWKNPSGENVKL